MSIGVYQQLLFDNMETIVEGRRSWPTYTEDRETWNEELMHIQDQTPLRQGYLYRRTKNMKKWKRRWFVLRDVCLISYGCDKVGGHVDEAKRLDGRGGRGEERRRTWRFWSLGGVQEPIKDISKP
jgi:hypothetical protein